MEDGEEKEEEEGGVERKKKEGRREDDDMEKRREGKEGGGRVKELIDLIMVLTNLTKGVIITRKSVDIIIAQRWSHPVRKTTLLIGTLNRSTVLDEPSELKGMIQSGRLTE